MISFSTKTNIFPDVQEDEDKSVEGDRDTAGKEDGTVDVVTPADIPAFYSRQVLCRAFLLIMITCYIKGWVAERVGLWGCSPT